MIHRSGRTGRAGKHGLSIILFSPNNIKTYNRIIDQAKIVPKLKKNLSKKDIEDHENDQFLKKISSISENKLEDKLIYELVKNYSSKDLAKALVSFNKLKIAPIEEVENIKLNSKKEYEKDKFKFLKRNVNKRNLNRKRKRKRTDKRN